jgi:hypothetical protein
MWSQQQSWCQENLHLYSLALFVHTVASRLKTGRVSWLISLITSRAKWYLKGAPWSIFSIYPRLTIGIIETPGIISLSLSLYAYWNWWAKELSLVPSLMQKVYIGSEIYIPHSLKAIPDNPFSKSHMLRWPPKKGNHSRIPFSKFPIENSYPHETKYKQPFHLLCFLHLQGFLQLKH